MMGRSQESLIEKACKGEHCTLNMMAETTHLIDANCMPPDITTPIIIVRMKLLR